MACNIIPTLAFKTLKITIPRVRRIRFTLSLMQNKGLIHFSFWLDRHCLLGLLHTCTWFPIRAKPSLLWNNYHYPSSWAWSLFWSPCAPYPLTSHSGCNSAVLAIFRFNPAKNLANAVSRSSSTFIRIITISISLNNSQHFGYHA